MTEKGEWQIDTSDPRKTVHTLGSLTVVVVGGGKKRTPPTTNTVMRTGGGLRVAVLDSLTGDRMATPDEIARYLALVHNATHIPAVESPVPLAEGLIPPPSFVEEI